jgi:hypothetical protein
LEITVKGVYNTVHGIIRFNIVLHGKIAATRQLAGGGNSDEEKS